MLLISMVSDGRSAPIRRSVARRTVKQPPRISRLIIHTPQWAEMRLVVIADSTPTLILSSRGAPTIQSVTWAVQATRPSLVGVGTEFRFTHALRGVLLPFRRDGLSKAHAPSITRRVSCRTSLSLSWEITPPPPARRIADRWAQNIPSPVSNIQTNVTAVRDGREEWSLRVRLRTTAQCLVKEMLQTRTVAVVLGGSKCTSTLRDAVQ